MDLSSPKEFFLGSIYAKCVGISRFLVLAMKELINYRQLLKVNLSQYHSLPFESEFLLKSEEKELA